MIKSLLPSIEGELKLLLIPNDPNDDANIFLEIRAGTEETKPSYFGRTLLTYMKFAESTD